MTQRLPSPAHTTALVPAMVALLVACSGAAEPVTAKPAGPVSTQASAPDTAAEVDVDGLAAAMAAGEVHLVDVRTAGEYSGGHAPGAINIPLPELETRLGELEAWKDGPVYLICASGRRSAAAQELLAGKGFSQTINVRGGTSGWHNAGHPLEK